MCDLRGNESMFLVQGQRKIVGFDQAGLEKAIQAAQSQVELT